MLENTFIILNRITLNSEKKLWEQGITTWKQFLETKTIKGISKLRKSYYDKQLTTAKKEYLKKNWAYFANILSSSEQWRLYSELKDDCVYLDIETFEPKTISILGMFSQNEYFPFVFGKNLEKSAFLQFLDQFSMIVTFNGTSFDLPLIEHFFGISLKEKLHFDVRHAAKKIRLEGGLKSIEKQLNIRRESTITGGDAIRLFKVNLINSNDENFQKILDYNEEDCKNLEHVCTYVVNNLKNDFLFYSKKVKT